MDNFELLAPTVQRLYYDLKNVYFLILPLFFAIALIITWFSGSGDFIEKVKRIFIGSILLISFPEITQAILDITNGLADRIDDMSGLENLMQNASAKMKNYQSPTFKSLLVFGDMMISALSYLSYLVLYCARFIMIAIYHFSWSFLTILSPIILLFHVFCPKMTINLFKSMIEIASWKVVWAILSVVLKSLSWADVFKLEGHYLTLIVANFVIALCMVATPLVVRSIVGTGFTAFTSSLTPIVAMTMVSTKTKALKLAQFSRNLIKK